jgi:uncharacterized protein (DUF1501 family)
MMACSRRDFLKATLTTSTLLSFSSVSPNVLIRTAGAGAARRDEGRTVLVVIQLSGGNDGLNTVVPYGDDAYARNRPTLALPPKELHKIDSFIGFHPRMGAFKRLYDEGYLSILQGVGSPNPDRSHEGAMRIWHTADPDSAYGGSTGWLGRVVDNIWHSNMIETPAVFVGPITQPFALTAESAIVPSIRSASDLTTNGQSVAEQVTQLRVEGVPPSNRGQSAKGGHDTTCQEGSLLNFLWDCTLKAHADSRRIKTVTKKNTKMSGYPSFRLAGTLQTVAQLIRADIGIRVFFTELGGGGIGGFDNHANQRGNHCALLHQLSESVAAFVRDLERDKLLDRVLLMTFSEFGRTVKENGRRGTGHGAAAPIFLAGGKLKGGLLGSHPSLTDLDNGALKVHTDFRRIYATVLDRWLGFESRSVLGQQFEPLDIVNI